MAILFIMISVLSWGVYPVIAAVVTENISFWDFIFWTQVFAFVSAWILLKIIPGSGQVPYKTLKDYTGTEKRDLFLYVSGFIGSQICLLLSFQYLSKVGATVAFEVWPIIAMYLAPIMMKKSWDTIPKRDFFFTFIAIIGVVFVLYPETKSLLADADLSKMFLPLLGGACMAIGVSFKARVAQNIILKEKPFASLVAMQATMGWCFLPVTFLFAVIFSDKAFAYNMSDMFAMGFVGIITFTFGNLLYTWAMLSTKHANIGVLWYLMPVFCVVCFWLTNVSMVTDAIIIGLILIIGSNILVSARADQKLAYVMTLVSLLATGVGCYYLDGLGMGGDYYEAIGVPIVFFVVVVAFIMDRLIRRDTQEEGLAINLMHEIIENLDISQKNKAVMIDNLTQILRTNKAQKINKHYETITALEYKNAKWLSSDLDKLLLSKMQTVNFGDLFVTALIGILTVGVTIVFRPLSFVADSFAIALTGAMVFIFFNMADLLRARKEFHLDYTAKGKRKYANNILQDNGFNILLSTVLIFLLLCAFTGLLWYKHYG